MEYEKTIKDAEELAKILIKKKARKTIGIYYFMWGFYYLYSTLISAILYNLNVTNVISILLFSAVAIPVYYTYKMIRDINWEYTIQRHKIKNLEKARKRYNMEFAISYAVSALIATLVFFVIIPFSTNEMVRLGAISLFIVFLLYWLYKTLYSADRLVDPRYYDLLVVVSFPFFAPAMAGLAPPIMIFSISMLIAMAWLYAGFRSILEVSEIE